MSELVAIVSGGMDSTTMLYELVASVDRVAALSFDYGQRHVRELGYAQQSAKRLGVEHHVVDLTSLRPLLKGSALTDEAVGVPEGHYAADSMRATVVPNRNAIMLNIATAWAVSRQAHGVATAVHAGDHFIYPDCRPEFIAALTDCVRVANEGFIDPTFAIVTPFLHKTKAQIAARGGLLGVPWTETWSCYAGGAVHCGACGTCVERREAFELAGVADPTEYAARPSLR